MKSFNFFKYFVLIFGILAISISCGDDNGGGGPSPAGGGGEASTTEDVGNGNGNGNGDEGGNGGLQRFEIPGEEGQVPVPVVEASGTDLGNEVDCNGAKFPGSVAALYLPEEYPQTGNFLIKNNSGEIITFNVTITDLTVDANRVIAISIPQAFKVISGGQRLVDYKFASPSKVGVVKPAIRSMEITCTKPGSSPVIVDVGFSVNERSVK